MATPAGKVLPPALPAAWVDRPRLRSRLDEARGRRLTVVVAGAGFGKSSLLAAWLAHSRSRSAWYSLRREDQSLPTFLRGLVDTLWLRLPGLPLDLSTVRAVLDPERRLAPDRFVAADRHAVWVADLLVDVEEFLASARAALAAHARGEADQALALLTSAEAAYAGDFLEEDRYEDWAVPLREEARAAYLAVTRTLARIAAVAVEHDLVRFMHDCLQSHQEGNRIDAAPVDPEHG